MSQFPLPPTPTTLKKVSWNDASWTGPGAPTYWSDGRRVVFLSPGEDVVCLENNWQHCTHGHEINGWTVVTLFDHQKVVCEHNNFEAFGGPNCVCVRNGQGLDGAEHIQLLNRPFPKAGDAIDWNTTAVVIMDMWNTHPINEVRARVKLLAPQIESFVSKLRSRGSLIIHSVSTNYESRSMTWPMRGLYDRTEARHNAIRARFPWGVFDFLSPGVRQAYQSIGVNLSEAQDEPWRRQLTYYCVDGESNLGNPNDFYTIVGLGYHGGIDNSQQPSQQDPSILIHDEDAIVGDGIDGTQNGNAYQEVLALTQNRPNIIFCGVATNQCILRRTNGMRTMYRAGKSLWIVRDLTDAIGVPDPNYATEGYTHEMITDKVVNWIGYHLNARTDTSDTA